MSETYVALDLETSGTEHGVHRTIQVGLALGALDTFGSYVAWPAYDLPWDDEAAKIHRIDRASVALTDRTPRPYPVLAPVTDAALAAWLRDRGTEFVAVGWNVGGFDMPFLRRDLPGAAGLFSRRTVDLNAVCFTLDLANREAIAAMGKQGLRVGWRGWKRAAKRHAVAALGLDNTHDAIWDAQASWLAWAWLAGRTREGAVLP